MRAKELFGTTVLDKNVNEIGRIEDIDVEIEKGGITTIIVSLNKGLFSNDVIEIDFESILTIGDYVLLDKVVETEETEKAEEAEDDKEDKESEGVTIEVESDEE